MIYLLCKLRRREQNRHSACTPTIQRRGKDTAQGHDFIRFAMNLAPKPLPITA